MSRTPPSAPAVVPATTDPDDPTVVDPDGRIAPQVAAAVSATKPRLRGWIHAATVPVVTVAGLVLVAVPAELGERVAAAVFVATAMLMFATSAAYHRGRWTPREGRLLRRMDHANIFLIIAGTYTPIAVGLLEGSQRVTLLAIAWGGALLGVAFRLFWLSAPRWSYVLAYLALGWVAVFYMPALWRAGGPWPTLLLAAGGLLYTIGAIAYARKRPNPSPTWFGFHEVFHLCTVLAFACHFAAAATALAVTA
jgi:hemolysin III